MDWWNVVLVAGFYLQLGDASTWSEWWTYDGISGPDFWGLVNPEWYVCTKGKRQSPIDIDPSKLLFDGNLRPLVVDKHRMSGKLENNGHDVRLKLDEPFLPTQHYVNISAGPLSYQYRVSEIILHYGVTNVTGSEHTINGVSFPAEVQILGYNSDLYGNLSQARHSSNGLVMIALLVQIGKTPNPEFNSIAEHLKAVKYKGQKADVRHLSVYGLLPPTENYITYEGSLTQPGCEETVTWIVFNKPLYISYDNLKAMRDVMQGDASNPKATMGNNYRRLTSVNARTVRTNINFHSPTAGCTMERQVYYQATVMQPAANPTHT